MRNRTHLLAAIGLALAHWGPAAFADGAARPSRGIEEIDDGELATMRGRYTVDDHTVAWFGVSMISTWQTPSGQTVSGALTLAMDFSGARPKVSFQPTVTITAANAPLPDTASAAGSGLAAAQQPARRIDSSGLANAGGVVQSVQVAGDGNRASNLASLSVRDGGNVPAAAADAPAQASASAGDIGAIVGYDGRTASVQLSVAGQGVVQQWIRSGSVGQGITLTADNQLVSNQLQIDLVRRAAAAGNGQLALNVAQAIGLNHGIGAR
ncbi:hypothetical protein [Fulvimonas soli]|jgi:hypothetical protein|uniref:Uncharacterized protein n=1 Tax=Fulvimonas soli TaxID=155197 RepID=A0A316I1V5_9GAMM|nr:hypothetical protein C7456_10710 [Fulvimonas soli]TNY25549.1 hypothetical protein BV497_13355 [Fulvimonas soli]